MAATTDGSEVNSTRKEKAGSERLKQVSSVKREMEANEVT